MSERPGEWARGPVTDRQLATIENFKKTGYDLTKIEQCALDAGYPKENAKVNAVKAIRRIANNPLMQKALKKQGVTMKRLAKKLDELLDCKHPQFPDQNDNVIQMRAVELGVRLHDALPNPKLEIDTNETIHIHITGDLLGAIEKATGQKVVDLEPDGKGGFE